MDDQYKDAIIEAIPAIKNQSKRPDRELIAKHVASKYGLNPSRAIEIIEKLLTDAVTPCGMAAHDRPFYDDRDLSDGSRIFGNPIDSNLLTQPDASNSNGGVKFRTQNAGKNEDSMSLVTIIGNMANSISELNSMLNCERNKTEHLLTENFSLKLKNQELQTLVESLLNSQKSHNKSEVAASRKTLEIRSELITKADRHHKESNNETDSVIELSKNEQ
eukprot:Seg2264.2 transcript_id=Seg2264.2/GoldUCD/mRNA.D3Y31 product="hypothetical protein" protein_id=Seg2264.2/GoldUCD/D3Y31